MQNSDHASAKGPPGRKPGLQHPADRRAHQGRYDEETEPWVSGQNLACGENQTLCWKVHRHISWLHVNVEAFEVSPKSRSGVGEPPQREGVRGKQKTEIVLAKGLGDGDQRQQDETQEKRAQTN